MDRLYLRLSVTDRCNLRCTYCLPPEGAALVDQGEILTFEETVRIVQAIDQERPLGKIRLTGGEPLLRRDLPSLVASLSQAVPGASLCMTTNGTLLARHATALKDAGLARVNVSLDTLDEEKYRTMTRGGELRRSLEGIRAARDAGLAPLRVNCVVQAGFNDDELLEMMDFALREELQLRFLELMSIGEAARLPDQPFLSSEDVIQKLSSRYTLRRLRRDGTAVYYEADDGARSTRLGFISPVSDPFCQGCNRIRLDARGRLFPCLQLDRFEALAPRLRSGDLHLKEVLDGILDDKTCRGSTWRRDPMSAIGG